MRMPLSACESGMHACMSVLQQARHEGYAACNPSAAPAGGRGWLAAVYLQARHYDLTWGQRGLHMRAGRLTFMPSYAPSTSPTLHLLMMLLTSSGCGWSHTLNTFSWLTKPKPLCVAYTARQRAGKGTHACMLSQTYTYAMPCHAIAAWRESSLWPHCNGREFPYMCLTTAGCMHACLAAPNTALCGAVRCHAVQWGKQCTCTCTCMHAVPCILPDLQVVERLAHVTVRCEDDGLQALRQVRHLPPQRSTTQV